MKKWMLLLMVFPILGRLGAQERVEVFGYFESQVMGTDVGSDFYQLYSNKLRVDLKSGLSERMMFAANFDYITYHGKTTWNILDFLAPRVTAAVPDSMVSLYVFPFSDRQFLDNAYIKLRFRDFDLTVGKQQISLGTGYVWNPTDVFNIKDVLDPTYEQPGHNAIRLDVPLGTVYNVSVLYSPEESWEGSAKLVWVRGRIARFDYSLMAVERIWRFHDYTTFVEMLEKRRLLGFSTAGELFGLGLWAEYGYNRMEQTRNFYELVVGSDYTFDSRTYVMVEYYRHTLGKTDYRTYDLNDWMRYFTNEQKAISRDQAYVLIQHPVTDFVTLGLSGIYSLSDGSLALVPTLNTNLSENLDVLAYLNVNFGKEGTAFSRTQGSGGLLRARVYF